jgi:hypothetical protein
MSIEGAVFYDNESKSDYVWRAKQFIFGLKNLDVECNYSFYSHDYIIIEYEEEELSEETLDKIDDLLLMYADDNEDDEDDDVSGRAVDVKQILFTKYLEGEIDIPE